MRHFKDLLLNFALEIVTETGCIPRSDIIVDGNSCRSTVAIRALILAVEIEVFLINIPRTKLHRTLVASTDLTIKQGIGYLLI